MKKLLVFLCAALLVFAVAVRAEALTFDAIDRGFYLETGAHEFINKNTSTGRFSSQILNSFFIFDLSTLITPVASGALDLELEEYFGDDPTETFTVFDVGTTPVSNLRLSYLAGSTAGQSIFSDLESGNVYGSATVSSTDVGSVISISLSAQAIADINASTGSFAVGLAVNEPVSSFTNEGVRFSAGNEPRIHQLTLDPVPEPATMLLLGTGLVGLAGFRRKCRK